MTVPPLSIQRRGFWAVLLTVFFSVIVPSAASSVEPEFDPQAKVMNIFDSERLRLTAEYSRIHYGFESATLHNPKMIVLHYTAFATFDESYRFFLPPLLDSQMRSDIASGGKVNVSSHYLVDRDGTLYQLAAEDVICRHIIGFNYTALGIENVGRDAGDLTEAQSQTDAALVSRMVKRHPSIEYLIGHQEYRDTWRPHYTLFLEKDRTYKFTTKYDPGTTFLQRVRALLKENYGIVLRD